MKTSILAFLLLFSCGALRAQCPEGNMYLTSQFEVDTFGANWPNCETITGDLHLGKYSQLANIGKFNGIGATCRKGYDRN